MSESRKKEGTSHLERKQAVSGSVIEEIERFLRYGDMQEHVLKQTDLSALYAPGEYEFCMGIYRPEKRYPRILAEEFFMFYPEIGLTVCEKQSFFHLRKRKKELPGPVWYRREGAWERAEQDGAELRIPADAFTYTVGLASSLAEGDVILAFPRQAAEPGEADCRELNVHFWQGGERLWNREEIIKEIICPPCGKSGI